MTDDPAGFPLGAGGPIGANPSFFDLVSRNRPEAVRALSGPHGGADMAHPHGTTVLGLKYEGGVVFAGDTRATEGFTIADDKMEKVFAADDYSA
ncbi:MAG: proteasome subunit beta, partial [Actinomycetota bacterium]